MARLAVIPALFFVLLAAATTGGAGARDADSYGIRDALAFHPEANATSPSPAASRDDAASSSRDGGNDTDDDLDAVDVPSRRALAATPTNTLPIDLSRTRAPGSVALPASWDHRTVDASSCDGFLHVELWDTERVDVATGEYTPMPRKAHPLLAVRYGADAAPTWDAASRVWKFDASANTDADEHGFEHNRAYMHVSIDLRTCATKCSQHGNWDGGACAAACVADPLKSSLFHIGVYNFNGWATRTLRYDLKAACVASTQPPCPRPLGAAGGYCGSTIAAGSRGTCGWVNGDSGRVTPKDAGSNRDDTADDYGACACNDGYGNVGCESAVTTLRHGTTRIGSADRSEWALYTVDVGASSSSLVVEMTRSSGDPVMFVKPAGEFGETPSIDDFELHADVDGFRSRENFHYKRIALTTGTYYVGVYDNDLYVQETANFVVRAWWSAPTLGPLLCPANCDSPRGGTCVESGATSDRLGECRCAERRGGEHCRGELVSAGFGYVVSGKIAEGKWLYLQFEVSAEQARASMRVVFTKKGGHPTLQMKKGDFPTFLSADVVISQTQFLPEQTTFTIRPRYLSEGTHYLGVFNMGYYADGTCEFVIELVTDADEWSWMPPRLLTIAIVVVLILAACLLLAVCKRCVERNRERERRGEAVTMFGFPRTMAELARAGLLGGHVAPAGCPREVIDAIPSFKYSPETFADVSGGKEDAICSVCIDPFEEGDEVRALPMCEHAFHKECIDEWLSQNTTCPNCRASLPLPEVEGGGGGGDGDGDGGDDGAASPRPVTPRDIELGAVAGEGVPGEVETRSTPPGAAPPANEDRRRLNPFAEPPTAPPARLATNPFGNRALEPPPASRHPDAPRRARGTNPFSSPGSRGGTPPGGSGRVHPSP